MLLLMTLNLDTIFDERKHADDLIDGWMIWIVDGHRIADRSVLNFL